MAYSGGETSATTLNSVFQECYADGFPPFYPDVAILGKSLKFKGASGDTGGKFIVPVRVSREHGWTYKKARGGMFDLNGVRSAQYSRAEVEGTNLVGQAGIDYEAAARASKGKKSFVIEMEDMLKNMREDGAFRQELSYLYGQSGLGAVNATTAIGQTAVPISAATWSALTWSGAEGARITFVSADGVTVRGTYEISSVVIDEDDANYRKINLSTAIATNGLTAGDLAFWETAAIATEKNECLGLHGILNTQSGTLFNLSVTTSPLWRASRYNVSGALSVTHLVKAALRPFNKTGLAEEYTALINPTSFQGLLNTVIDPATANGPRKLDASYSKKLEVGHDSVRIYAQNGSIVVKPHALVREGDFFMGPLARLRKVGARDMSFETPGSKGEIFVHNPSKAGYEVRCYSNLAIMPEQPAQFCYGYGIVNT